MTRIDFGAATEAQRATITDEDQAAIDAYLAKNKVKKIPRGVSGLPDPAEQISWKAQKQKNHQIRARQRKFERAAQRKASGALWGAVGLLAANGPMSAREIADALGANHRAMRKQLKALREAGQVEMVGNSNQTKYRVAA